MQLKIEGREGWTDKAPSLNDKRNAINDAKKEDPREIEAIILKNRMFKTGSKAEFKYYPQFDYFEEKKEENKNHD